MGRQERRILEFKEVTLAMSFLQRKRGHDLSTENALAAHKGCPFLAVLFTGLQAMTQASAPAPTSSREAQALKHRIPDTECVGQGTEQRTDAKLLKASRRCDATRT
ncbi:hypothetical protein [Oryza sativa Japonica Group]|uniref:Uncharacterized protein n=1 Tax=Oryza sativa subsp. japonica TaxID=39947 RepID=Q5ZDK6_ORYSJ|nr:hypothetical protein [Oryza sativa Japonica Group]